MSRLKELIQEYCPDGVEYKRFEDVCTLHARIGWQRLTRAEYMPEGDYLLITGTDFTDSHEINYESCVYVTKNRYDQDSKIQVENGDVLITKDGTLGKVAQVTNLPMPATLNGGVFVVRPINNELLPRFIMHFLLSKHFKDKVFQQKTGSTISHLTQGLFSRLEIPIPPLPVQQEIVRILDSFSNLEQELEQELELRKRQYTACKQKLFSFNNNVTWKPINSFAECVTGATPSTHHSEYWENGTIPWMSSGEVHNRRIYSTEKFITKAGFDNSSTHMIPTNAVVIALAGQGKTRGTVAMTKIPLCTNQSLCSIVIKNSVLPEYLYYYLETQYEKLRSLSNGEGSRGGLNLKIVGAFKVPVPSMEEQKRIVSVLDPLFKYCTDLTSGLPAEISLRKKQYEYYRDRLLSFPRKA